ncbi:MAG: hypothetical protein FJ102_19400 [Deltaproteobacteria bacterium]|nr:hypothetical protein [Deltaproteobacteria bacterium]
MPAALAKQLIAGFRRPDRRARRIAAVYASLYLLDPIRHDWCGLAAFVSRRVHDALESRVPLAQRVLARGSLAIYESVAPAFFARARGEEVDGRLAQAFGVIAAADLVARRDERAARNMASDATLMLSRVEQAEIVQPLYDRLGGLDRAALARHFGFRLGRDSADPWLACPGDATRLEVRLSWMEREVIPAWARWQVAEPARVRAALDHIRRDGKLSLAALLGPP